MPDNHRKPRTRHLRHNMTDAEARLWFLLRGRRLADAKFRRQVPIGPYVVDFFCHEHGLIVEADGGQHLESRHDAKRTQYLEQQGCAVLRFWNDEILNNQDAVLTKILEALSGRAPSPAATRRPLPEGEANNNEGAGA